jgi:hypothetical protein
MTDWMPLVNGKVGPTTWTLHGAADTECPRCGAPLRVPFVLYGFTATVDGAEGIAAYAAAGDEVAHDCSEATTRALSDDVEVDPHEPDPPFMVIGRWHDPDEVAS